MKFLNLSIFALCLAAFTPQASATVATLGLSNEPFNLTGIGADTSGQGQASVSFGNCTYDGTTTHCTLSGNYTGFNGGGTYSFVATYVGNGAFPLIAVFPTPSTNLFQYAAGPNYPNSNFSLVITLTPTGQAPINFYSFANFSFFYPSTRTCTGVPTCAAGTVSLTPGATINGPVNGTFDPTPFIQTPGVIAASAYGAFSSIAPADWIEIYGVNLANTLSQQWATSDFKGIQAPTALAGTSVTVAGKPAYVYYVSPGQVNVQVPSGIGTGPQPVILTTAGGTSSAFTVTVNTLEPGLLAPPSFVIKGNQYVVALLAGTLTYNLPVTLSGIATQRARAGDILTLYGVGFGTTSDNIPAGQIVQATDALQNSLQIFFGGVPATVSYAGLAPGFVGLYQFNVAVPNGVAASDTVPVTFKLNGVAGPQALVTSIQN